MKGKQKTLMLKIIIILIVVLTVDVFAPFSSSQANIFAAALESFWEGFFKEISKFLADISDVVIQSLQKLFVGDADLTKEFYNEDEFIVDLEKTITKYYIKYSPRYNIFWKSSSI